MKNSIVVVLASLAIFGCGSGSDNQNDSNTSPIDPPTTTPPAFTPSKLSLEQYQQVLEWENSYIVNSSYDGGNHFDEDAITLDVFANDPIPYSIKYTLTENTFEEGNSYTESIRSNIWNGTSWNLASDSPWISTSDQMQVVDDHLSITSSVIDTTFKLYAQQIDLSSSAALNKALNLTGSYWNWDNAGLKGFGYKTVVVPEQTLIHMDIDDSYVSEGSIAGKTVQQIAAIWLPSTVEYEIIGDDTFRAGDFTWTIKHDNVANLNLIRVTASYSYAGVYQLTDSALLDYQGAIHKAVIIEPKNIEDLQLIEASVGLSLDNAIRSIIHLQSLVNN